MSGPGRATDRGLATTFTHSGVAAAYAHRPPYPDEVFDLLEALVVDEPRTGLDLGAGEGAIARPLAARLERVDALDISPAMVEAGRRRPGGDRPGLRWIVGAAESAALEGPYALVTAGASLHWMPWEATLRRLVAVMTPRAQLAVVEHGPRNPPWQDDLAQVIRRHSRSPDHDPSFSVVAALQERDLYDVGGSRETTPVPYRQSVADYVEQFHSTASLARELMTEQEALEFDRAVERVVRPWAPDGTVELAIVAVVTWGRPKQPRG